MKETIINELKSLINQSSSFKGKDQFLTINDDQGIEWIVVNHPITDQELGEFQQICIKNSNNGQFLVNNLKTGMVNGQQMICFDINDMVKKRSVFTISTVKSPPLILIPNYGNLSNPYMTGIPVQTSQVQSKEVKLPDQKIEVPSKEKAKTKLQYPEETYYLTNSLVKKIQKKARQEIPSLKQTDATFEFMTYTDSLKDHEWNSIDPLVTNEEEPKVKKIIIDLIQEQFGKKEQEAASMVKSWKSSSGKGHRFAIKVSGFKGLLDPITCEPLPLDSLELKQPGSITPRIEKMEIQIGRNPIEDKTFLISVTPTFGIVEKHLPPTHLIYVIDTSASMGDAISEVKKGLIRVLNELSQDIHSTSQLTFTLITFDLVAKAVLSNVKITKDNIGALTRTVDEIQANGSGTDICGGMQETIKHCQDENNKVVFITDGAQNILPKKYSENLTEVFRNLNTKLIPYFGLIGYSAGVSIKDLSTLKDIISLKLERNLPFEFVKESEMLSSEVQKHFKLAMTPNLPPSAIVLEISGKNGTMEVKESFNQSIEGFMIGSTTDTIPFTPTKTYTTFAISLSITHKGRNLPIGTNVLSNTDFTKNSTTILISQDFKNTKYEENTSLTAFVDKFTHLTQEHESKKKNIDEYLSALKILEEQIKKTLQEISKHSSKPCTQLSEFCTEIVGQKIKFLQTEISQRALGKTSMLTSAQQGDRLQHASNVSKYTSKHNPYMS